MQILFVTDLSREEFELDPLFSPIYEPKINFNGVAGVGDKAYHHINRQGITEIVDKLYLNRYLMYNISAEPIVGTLVISKVEEALKKRFVMLNCLDLMDHIMYLLL